MKLFERVKKSFINATRGKESFKIVAWIWGGIFYFTAIFFLDFLVKRIDVKSFDIFLSCFCIVYASWHFYVTVKCFPKSLEIANDDKERERLKKNATGNSFARKLLLQEPFIKMNRRNILILLDSFIILHFFSYL